VDRKTVTREDFEKSKRRSGRPSSRPSGTIPPVYLAQAQQAKKVQVNYELFLRLNTEILGRYRTSEAGDVRSLTFKYRLRFTKPGGK
jgi:hypothetical protein